ncbi:MAG: hypothetical protein JWO91_1282 [Acidobacteriaceae bacterium]|jgi:hypothetical protein|nr:hypothetical protein [Acidobacteriaceae bacterium]
MASSLDLGIGYGSATDFMADHTNFPERLFYCRLDEQPDHLVPERYLQDEPREDSAERPLFVNPQFQFARNGLPDSLQHLAPSLDNFDLRGDVIWIKAIGSRAALPFWVEPEFMSIMAGMRPGNQAPTALSPERRRVLAMAGVLVPPDYDSARRRHWETDIELCATKFSQRKYVPIGRLIHPFHISALRRYYRLLIRRGRLKLGDSQTARRYGAQNESVSRFFHQQLTPTVSAIVGQPVKPSYTYLGSYQSGANLEIHTDREQCEFSITFCLDFSPEPRHETPWPIHLHTSKGKATVFQGLGDSLIYCGGEIPHSRDVLPPGYTSTSIFFHYVRESFQGRLD